MHFTTSLSIAVHKFVDEKTSKSAHCWTGSPFAAENEMVKMRVCVITLKKHFLKEKVMPQRTRGEPKLVFGYLI